MRPTVLFTILAVSQLFINVSCAAKKQPKWVKKHPIDNTYYIGIGIASKSENPVDYVDAAKKKAMADLVSEISVQISSNSVFEQIETSSSYKENFQSVVRSQLQDNIKGHELIDTWESKEEYWVYYQLSKEKYARQKRLELDKAKKISSDFLEQGQISAKKYDYTTALTLYSKAIAALNDHFTEDLTIMTVNGKINLASTILKEIQNIYANTKLEATPNSLEVEANKLITTPIVVEAYTYQGNQKVPLQRLQLKAYFTKGKGEVSPKIQTGFNGKVNPQLNKITSKESSQTLRIELDIDDIFANTDIDKSFLNTFFNKGQQPATVVNIKVEGLTAYFEMNETYNDKTSTNNTLSNLVKSKLSEEFFTFTNNKEKAALTVVADATTRDGDLVENAYYKLYSVFTSVNVTITDNNTGEEVFVYKTNNIEGRQSRGYETARQDAYKKLINQLDKEFIPQLQNMDVKN